MNILNTLLLLGALQGFIMSVLLWRQQNGELKNRLLAGIVFILVLENWGTYCFTTGLVTESIVFYCSSFSFVLLLGPLLYKYTVYLSTGKITWRKLDLLHLTPLLIEIINYQAYFFYNPTLPLVELPLWQVSMTVKQYTVAISVFVYLHACQRLIRRAAPCLDSPSYPADPSGRHLRFLTRIYWILFITNVSWGIYLVLRHLGATPVMPFLFYGLHLVLSLLIYWMGLEGYWLHRESTQLSKPSKSKTPMQLTAPEQLTSQVNRIKQTLEVEQVYLQADLSLESLARQVGLHPKVLSQVINQQFGVNFNELINHYRVAEAKRRLVNTAYNHLTIEGIAQQVGFTSKTTFNRAFRAETSMSANEYKKSKY